MTAAYFDPLVHIIGWVGDSLGLHASTVAAPDGGEPFAVVERVGGECEFPHDMPQFAVQVWALSDVDAEGAAYALCRLLKTDPPKNAHVNAVGTPSITSYSPQEGGWRVWQVTFSLACRII